MEFLPKKKFGFGLMRLPHIDPNDAGSIDLEEAKKMVDLFLAKGFTYFDTACKRNTCEKISKGVIYFNFKVAFWFF